MISSYSYVTILKGNEVPITPQDLNMLITTVLAHPSFRRTFTTSPLCLSGIADDGYIYLTTKYIAPNIGVLFVSQYPESFHSCLAKIDNIALALDHLGLVREITNAIRDNYLVRSVIVPNGNSAEAHCRPGQ